nr:hypothetical protein [Tanacetum cinerariifolium]
TRPGLLIPLRPILGVLQQRSGTSSEGQGYAKEFGSHCKVLQEDLQTYQQQPQNILKLKEQECRYDPREKVGSPVVQQSGIQCFNCKEYRHFAKECRKPKRVKDFVYHKDKMLLCKQAEQGVPLQAEQYDWLADMDEEVDEQELEAHYSYMAKIQEVPTAETGTDSEPVE